MEEYSYETINYAMHQHDVERIAEVETVDINENLRKGWVLLGLFTKTKIFYESPPFPVHTTTAYMGIPRPQFCTYNFINGHPDKVQQGWDHQNNEWECRYCSEHDAHTMNDIKDNPETDRAF